MKVRTEFSNYGENTKYHSNPYIQGTTVPCDGTTVLFDIYHCPGQLVFHLGILSFDLPFLFPPSSPFLTLSFPHSLRNPLTLLDLASSSNTQSSTTPTHTVQLCNATCNSYTHAPQISTTLTSECNECMIVEDSDIIDDLFFLNDH